MNERQSIPPPLSEEEIERLRHVHRNCGLLCHAGQMFDLLDAERTARQVAETERDGAIHRRQQALSLSEQRAETITAYARQLAELRTALAEERQRAEDYRTGAGEEAHEADRLREVLNDLSDILECSDDDVALSAIVMRTAQERMVTLNAVAAVLTCPESEGEALADWLPLAAQRAAQARAALAACEARLAEAQAKWQVPIAQLVAVQMFVQRVNARAEADILKGNPITGAHNRALAYELRQCEVMLEAYRAAQKARPAPPPVEETDG